MRIKKLLSLLLMTALLLSLAITNDTTSFAATTVEVDRVVDGDTFVTYINGEKTRIRMIGIDTPESVHPNESKNTKWGKKISKWVKKQLTGKKVKLKYDKDKYDQYGRTLAYVYLGKSMFNKTLLKKGYARAVYYAPNGKYRKAFNKLQATAKKKKKGFWKDGYSVAFP